MCQQINVHRSLELFLPFQSVSALQFFDFERLVRAKNVPEFKKNALECSNLRAKMKSAKGALRPLVLSKIDDIYDVTNFTLLLKPVKACDTP